MPHGQHGIFHIVLLYILIHAFVFPHDAAEAIDDTGKTSVYYIRLDQKIRNGVYETDSMTMVPADEDYRRLSFKTFVIKGMINAASKTDPLTAAKHDALERLLLKEGIKSIRNKSQRDMDNTYEESVISYEGYIRTPYSIKNQGYSDNSSTFSVELEVPFTPMAYPPEWTFLYFKTKICNAIDAVLSMFR